MNERRPRVHQSVFAKLVAVMATMAVCLLFLVSFFWLIVTGNVHAPIPRGTAHLGLLVLLLFVIAGVVLAAHLVLGHLLRPLRILSDGVARLGEGELDVHLPPSTPDEFAAFVEAEQAKWGPVVRATGVKLE